MALVWCNDTGNRYYHWVRAAFRAREVKVMGFSSQYILLPPDAPLFAIWLSLSLGFAVVAATQNKASVPDFTRLTVAEGETLLKEMSKVEFEGPFSYRDFVKVTLTARRLDLARVCFQFQHTRNLLFEEESIVPDSSFKDQMVLMMLRTESGFWPAEQNIFGKGEGYHPGMYMNKDLFRTVLAKYLPEQMSYANATSLDGLASRLKVAAALEKQMRAAGIEIPELAGDRLEGNLKKSLDADPAGNHTAVAKIPDGIFAVQEEVRTRDMPWLVVIITIVVVAWIFLKTKRRGE